MISAPPTASRQEYVQSFLEGHVLAPWLKQPQVSSSSDGLHLRLRTGFRLRLRTGFAFAFGQVFAFARQVFAFAFYGLLAFIFAPTFTLNFSSPLLRSLRLPRPWFHLRLSISSPSPRLGLTFAFDLLRLHPTSVSLFAFFDLFTHLDLGLTFASSISSPSPSTSVSPSPSTSVSPSPSTSVSPSPSASVHLHLQLGLTFTFNSVSPSLSTSVSLHLQLGLPFTLNSVSPSPSTQSHLRPRSRSTFALIR